MKKTNKKSFVGSVFIIGYVSAISFVGIVGHNHPINGGMHENCPACQWEIQTKTEDTYANDVFEIIQSQLTLTGYFVSDQIFYSIQKDKVSLNQERAPPFILL